MFNVPVLLFCMTKVRVLAVPKLVKFNVEVEMDPGVIEFEFPLTMMEDVGIAGVTDPEITPPGLIQA